MISDSESLHNIQKELSKEQLEIFTDVRFCDLVNTGTNALVQTILRIQMKLSAPIGNAVHTTNFLENQSKNIESLCQTFFAAGDNQKFLGESYLIKSKEETDKQQKKLLIDKGISSILQNPKKINLEIVIPALVEGG